MRMAFSIRAARLIFDRGDNSEYPVPAAVAINAKAVGAIQAGQRLRLSVAAIAGLGRLVENVANFGRVGRVADPPLLIKDSYLDHAGLVRHGLDRVVESLAIVAQHVVRRAAPDYIADSFRAGQRGGFQMLAMKADDEKTQQTENQRHRN